MAEEKQKLKYEEMVYVGREFNKKFTNNDGGEVKSYKYMFKQSSDSKWPTNFWGYDTTKGSADLEEGEEYVIGYINKPNTRGDKPLKIARFFGKPKEESQQSQPQPAPQEQQKKVGIPLELEAWYQKIPKDTFWSAFVTDAILTSKESPTAFINWIQTPDCDTDYITKIEDANERKAKALALFWGVVRRYEDEDTI